MLLHHIVEAKKEKRAIGHFNISTIEALWAIFNSAREMKVPVVIGVSEGERTFLGVEQVPLLVKSIREKFDYPIYSNADHTYSFEGVKQAVDAGYDAVIFDGAQLSFDENIEITCRCVDYAKSVNPDMVVEGELGYIGKSSELLDVIPEDIIKKGLTTKEQAESFVKKTGVDLLAPSVGNIHGMLKRAHNPHLSHERIQEIAEAVKIPLVLHGGSGIGEDDFREAIKSGISLIHVNTELRKAWRDGLVRTLEKDSNTVAPYRLLEEAKKEMEQVITKHLKVFNGF